MVLAFLVGLACGFFGSIPIAGPVAVLIVERALKGRLREAFAIGMGAALAEGGYALFAFLGMTAALGRFPWLLPVSRYLAAVILVGLGLVFALARRSKSEAAKENERRGGGFILGLVVTGLNPTLIATWSAVVTILHGADILRVAALDGFPFAIGAVLGIVGWFGLWIEVLRKFRRRVKESTLEKVVRVMGWLLVAGGVGLLVKLVLA
jgi:threonine/homoserine/homoserine lactone efflux protein